MVPLVTMDHARKHLRTGTVEDDLILRNILQGQAIVLLYISDATDADWTAEVDAWTADTVPPAVQAAILLQMGFLYRYRGDEPAEIKAEYGELASGVKACLYRIRKPVIA